VTSSEPESTLDGGSIDKLLESLGSDKSLDRINGKLSDMLTTCETECFGNSPVTPSDEELVVDTFPLHLKISIAVMTFGLAFLIYILWYEIFCLKIDFETIRNRSNVNTDTSVAEDFKSSLVPLQAEFLRNYEPAAIGEGLPSQTLTMQPSRSLCQNSNIWIGYRVLFPFAIVVVFSIFLWSNNSIGATVNVEIDIVDKKIGPIGIFTFGLG
jgi:hypothetical protein